MRQNKVNSQLSLTGDKQAKEPKDLISSINNICEFNDTSSLQALLKYPYRLLRIVGLYHQPDDLTALKVYSLFISLVNWLNFCRYLSAYELFYDRPEPLLAGLILKIITSIWLFICAFNSSLIYFNQERTERQQAFLSYCNLLYEAQLDSNQRDRLRRHINFIFILAILVSIANISLLAGSLFGPEALFTHFQSYLAPFHNTSWAPSSIAYKCFIILLISMTTIHFTMSNSLYLSHCMLVIHLLCAFNSKFSKFVHDSVLVASTTNE